MIASESDRIDEGFRLQKAGLLEEALQKYDDAAHSGDESIRARALCRMAALCAHVDRNLIVAPTLIARRTERSTRERRDEGIVVDRAFAIGHQYAAGLPP